MRVVTIMFMALAACLASVMARADRAGSPPETSEESEEHREAFRKVDDVPGLPRVLLVGDSISIGYTEPVRGLLMGKANVHRISENAGNTRKGRLRIDAWLADSDWDVIHFNWGLHDIRRDVGGRKDKSGPMAVPIFEYEANLRALVERFRKTGAQLIWASTTPVPPGEPKRNPADVRPYNETAAALMAQYAIPIDDLFAVSTERCTNLHTRPGNVHYSPEGSKVLAESVARSIEAVLQDTASTPTGRP